METYKNPTEPVSSYNMPALTAAENKAYRQHMAVLKTYLVLNTDAEIGMKKGIISWLLHWYQYQTPL